MAAGTTWRRHCYLWNKPEHHGHTGKRSNNAKMEAVLETFLHFADNSYSPNRRKEGSRGAPYYFNLKFSIIWTLNQGDPQYVFKCNQTKCALRVLTTRRERAWGRSHFFQVQRAPFVLYEDYLRDWINLQVAYLHVAAAATYFRQEITKECSAFLGQVSPTLQDIPHDQTGLQPKKKWSDNLK